jgi:uncharacterized membrane protein YeiH
MQLFAASTIATGLNMFLEQELIKSDSLIKGLTFGPFGGSFHDLVVRPVPCVFYPNSRSEIHRNPK